MVSTQPTHLKNIISSNWIISPGGENKKCQLASPLTLGEGMETTTLTLISHCHLEKGGCTARGLKSPLGFLEPIEAPGSWRTTSIGWKNNIHHFKSYSIVYFGWLKIKNRKAFLTLWLMYIVPICNWVAFHPLFKQAIQDIFSWNDTKKIQINDVLQFSKSEYTHINPHYL